VQWGDVPGWITAVATLLAFGGAAYAAVVAKRLYDTEVNRDQARDDAARKEQAARVSAWVDTETRPGPVKPPKLKAFGETEPARDTTLRVAVVKILNGSELPIYDVEVRFEQDHPGQALRDMPPSINLPVLGPGLITHDIRDANGHPAATAGYRAAITFTDAADQRWGRLTNGKLALVLTFEDSAMQRVVRGD
jgi:hypothetical protein